MKPVFVTLKDDILGGTATLSIRIGEYLVKNGYEVIYVTQVFNDVNNLKLMNEKGIIVYKWDIRNIYFNLFQRYNNRTLIFLTYTLHEFLFIENLRNFLNIKKNILYVVQIYGLILAINQNIITKAIAKRTFFPIIKKMLNNDNVIFMDKQSIIQTEKYYGFDIENKESLVFHLPMKTKKLELQLIEDKLNIELFNILTIARAEFPFKGYIIGLIDDFNELCNIYNNITLTIIAFGPDESQISEKVRQLPASIKNKINLVGQTPYDELYKFFNQAHLFLGMGTTILDAANHGVPSIAVQPYTYENNSSGFFHEQPEFLGGYEDKSIPAISYMKKVIEMSNEEYLELCQMEHRALEENYDISTLANYLINIEEDINPKTISDFELKLHKLMFKINKTRRTLIHKLRNKNRS